VDWSFQDDAVSWRNLTKQWARGLLAWLVLTGPAAARNLYGVTSAGADAGLDFAIELDQSLGLFADVDVLASEDQPSSAYHVRLSLSDPAGDGFTDASASLLPDAPASQLFVLASDRGLELGVSSKFAAFEDITAVFRPSRWREPFAVGGPLSWLNYRAWMDDPHRTGLILASEVIMAAVVYAVIEYQDDDAARDGGISGSVPVNTTSTTDGGGSTGGGGSGGGGGGSIPAPESSPPALPGSTPTPPLL
jgi:uncharacterized membrane protein YgcG